MKKTLEFLMITSLLLICSTMLFAQTESKGDTLIIGPLNSLGLPLGALNEAIKADVNTSGERIHKVYKLHRNAQYILTEVIQADFPLVLVADKPNKDNRPPIIRGGLREDGSAVNLWWQLFNHATFKNLWISGVNLDGTGPINWIAQEVNTTGKTIWYDGCIVEYPYTWWATFADWGGMNVYKLTNCIFQYIGNPTGTTWNGAICHSLHADSMIVRNSTFFNFGCFAVAPGDIGNFYTEVDHCTFVNAVVHPIDSHRHVIRKYTNNLFVNCHAFSDDDSEISRHFDVEVKGLMNYAEIQWDPQALDSLYGPGGVFGKSYDPNGDGQLTPEEQVWELKNNNWFYTQPIKDYWAQFGNVFPNPWMNNYNKAMFNSSDKTEAWTWDLKVYVWQDAAGNRITHPKDFKDLTLVDSLVSPQTHQPFKFFKEINTTNLDPGIVDMNDCDVSLAQNCINIRTEWAGGTVTNPVKWHKVDDYLAFTWPLDYDLAYTNEALKTGGSDGKPVGSLQWWPGIEYVPSAVQKIDVVKPVSFVLDQNYPNPFNPVTNITYSLSSKERVQIKVFNLLGVEVATLVDQTQDAGAYHISFDAKNLASGLYFYQLQAGKQIITRKMTLMR